MTTPPVNIFVALPCYGGQIHVGCFHSLLSLSHLCAAEGIGLSIFTQPSDSLITRARNSLVAEFLGHSQFTHFFFVDADITFRPHDVLHMIQQGFLKDSSKRVIAGCYPKKGLSLKRLRSIAQAEQTLSDGALMARALEYAVNVNTNVGVASPSTTHSCEVKEALAKTTVDADTDGFLRVDEIATGFMMIRRDVFTDMQKAYPEKQYINDSAGYSTETSRNRFYTFFDCMIDPISKRYLSEDYAFCYLCRQLGISIWVDLTVNLTHTGLFHYQGSYLTALQPPPLDA